MNKLILFLIPLLFWSCASSLPEYFSQAEKEIARGNYHDVIDECTSMLEEYPDSPELYTYRGTANHELRDYRGALSDLTKAIQLNPIYEAAYYYRGLTNEALKNKNDAIEDYFLAFEASLANKGKWEAGFDRMNRYNSFSAHILSGAKDSTLLQKIIRKSLEYDDASRKTVQNRINANMAAADSLFDIAEKKFSAGKYSDALDLITRVIRLNPTHAAYYNLSSIIKSQLDMNDQSMKDINLALRMMPEEAILCANRGIQKNRIGEYYSAIHDFDKALELDRFCTSAYIGRAFSHDALEYYSLAASDYSEVIKRDSTNADAFLSRARTYSKNKNYDEAIDDFTAGLKLRVNDPGIDELFLERAGAYASSGRPKSAIRDLDSAIKTNPRNSKAYFFRGLIKKREEIAGGVADIQQAAKLGNQDAKQYLAQ